MTTHQTENKAASDRVTGRDKIGADRRTDMQFRKGDRVRYNESGLRELMDYIHFVLLQAEEPCLAATVEALEMGFDVGTVEDIDEATDSMTIRWDSKQVKKECRFKWFRKAESGETSGSAFCRADPPDVPILTNEGLGIDVTRMGYNAFLREASRPTDG